VVVQDIDEDSAETKWVKHDSKKKAIDIVKFEGKRGWGGLKEDNDEYNEAFINYDSYPCGELTLKNPGMKSAAEDMNDFGSKKDEDRADALFEYGYNHRSQEHVPIFDGSFDDTNDLKLKNKLDKIVECVVDAEIEGHWNAKCP
jgi:hypothetical protein